MALAAATLALRDELEDPKVLGRSDLKAASRSFRPTINRVSEQASRLQQLLVLVEEDETNDEVLGQLESLRQTLRARQRYHDRAEKEYASLALCEKQAEVEAKQIVAIIRANE